MTASWSIAVVIVTSLLQFLAAFLVARIYAAQLVGFADRESASGFVQALIGAGILWFALELRPAMSTRKHVLLSLLGLVPFWGTLVAVAAELFIERQQSQTRSEHL